MTNKDLKSLLEWHQENANECEGKQGEKENYLFHLWAVSTLKKVIR